MNVAELKIFGITFFEIKYTKSTIVTLSKGFIFGTIITQAISVDASNKIYIFAYFKALFPMFLQASNMKISGMRT